MFLWVAFLGSSVCMPARGLCYHVFQNQIVQHHRPACTGTSRCTIARCRARRRLPVPKPANAHLTHTALACAWRRGACAFSLLHQPAGQVPLGKRLMPLEEFVAVTNTAPWRRPPPTWVCCCWRRRWAPGAPRRRAPTGAGRRAAACAGCPVCRPWPRQVRSCVRACVPATDATHATDATCLPRLTRRPSGVRHARRVGTGGPPSEP